MRGIAFGFRDYAIHLFPGCLVQSALLILFFDFNWISSELAPLLAISFLIGGYILGFFLDAISVVWVGKTFFWRLTGGDPLQGYMEGARIAKQPRDLREMALSILVHYYGEPFVRKARFTDLLYLIIRDIEATSERSAAFLSRINALENMSKNMGAACFWVTIILILNAILYPEQIVYSLMGATHFALLGVLMQRRRAAYRRWLATSALRSFVALERRRVANAGHSS